MVGKRSTDASLQLLAVQNLQASCVQESFPGIESGSSRLLEGAHTRHVRARHLDSWRCKLLVQHIAVGCVLVLIQEYARRRNTKRDVASEPNGATRAVA